MRLSISLHSVVSNSTGTQRIAPLQNLDLPALEGLYLAIEFEGPRRLRFYTASPNLRRVKKLTIHGGLRYGASEFKQLLRSVPALENLQIYALEGAKQTSEEGTNLIPNLDRCSRMEIFGLDRSLREISETDE